MDGAYLHLLINHAPLWGFLVGTLALAVSLLRKNDPWVDLSLWIIALSGLVTFGVYATGLPAEESLNAVKAMDPATQNLVDVHEEASIPALIATMIAGTGALSLLVVVRGPDNTPHKGYSALLLLGSLICVGFMGWVSHLGGQIHHDEVFSRQPVPEAPSEEK